MGLQSYRLYGESVFGNSLSGRLVRFQHKEGLGRQDLSGLFRVVPILQGWCSLLVPVGELPQYYKLLSKDESGLPLNGGVCRASEEG